MKVLKPHLKEDMEQSQKILNDKHFDDECKWIVYFLYKMYQIKKKKLKNIDKSNKS